MIATNLLKMDDQSKNDRILNRFLNRIVTSQTMDDSNNVNIPIEFTSEPVSTDGINKSSSPSAGRKSDYSSSDSSSDTEDYSDGDSISSVRRKKREIPSSKSIDWKLTYDLSMKKIGHKNIFATLSNDVPNCLVKSVIVYVCPYNCNQANMFSEEINQSDDVSLKYDDFYIVLDFLTPKTAKKALYGIEQTIQTKYNSFSVKRIEESNTSLICGFSENDLRCTDEIFDYIVDNLDCPPHKFEELYKEIKRRVHPERFPSVKYNLSEINYKEKNISTGVLCVLKRQLKESERKLKCVMERLDEKDLHFVMKSYYHGLSDGLKINIDGLKTNINMIEQDLAYDGYSVRKNDFH